MRFDNSRDQFSHQLFEAVIFNYTMQSRENGSSANDYSIPEYSIIYNKFIHPFFDILGIIGNVWILFTLGLGNVRISRTTKLYYIIIGVSDLSIITCSFIWLELCDALWIWTKGEIYFCIDILSLFTCIVMNLWYYLSEFVSNYTLVALSLERLIAICWPLRAKAILTKAFTIYLLIFLNVSGCLFYLILMPFSSAIIPVMRVVSYGCYIDDYNLFGIIFNISMPIIILGLHTLVDLAVSVTLFIKLYIFRSNVDPSINLKQGSKEISSTLTLLTLCLVTLVIYGVSLVSYVLTLSHIYLKIVSAEFAAIANIIYILFASSTNIPHGLNILVYLTFIPSFRQAAFCKLYEMTSRKSSTITAPAH